MLEKILIIEDEVITAIALEEFIESLGYIITDCVDNADDALNSIKKNKPDLIISDIMIKGKLSGCELACEVYNIYKIPIVFLTAHFNDEIFDYAKRANPKGYIIKPFKEQELEATIKLALHNETNTIQTKQNNSLVHFDKYTYDTLSQKLILENEEVKLSKKSLKVLDILCQNKDISVPYEMLINNLYEEINPNNLDNLRHIIKRLKTKLNISSIRSSKNIGYILKTKV